jgi:hypothetical protein
MKRLILLAFAASVLTQPATKDTRFCNLTSSTVNHLNSRPPAPPPSAPINARTIPTALSTTTSVCA